MNMALVRSTVVLLLAVAVTSAPSASAGLVIAFAESGVDVVATLSGSFAALPTHDANANAILGNRVAGGFPYFDSTTFASGTSVNLNNYDFSPSNFPVFGTSSSITNATSTLGLNTSVFVNSSRLSLPPAFSAGTSFTGSLTWAGQSFASLQLTPGSYVGTLSNAETVTINVVPEPSIYAMALAGLTCGGFSMWRRKRV